VFIGWIPAVAQVEIEEDTNIVPFYMQIDSIFQQVNMARMETNYLLNRGLIMDDPGKSGIRQTALWTPSYGKACILHS